MQKTQVCSKCKKEVDHLEVFSQGECLACHEKEFKFDGSLPDFTKTLTIK